MAREWETSKPGCNVVGFLVWFLGGISLSLALIFSLILLVLLAASVSLNVYLGWQLSGLQITISRPTPLLPQEASATPTIEAVVLVITDTPTAAVTGPPTAEPADLQVEEQLGTVAAIATRASTADESAAFTPPTATSSATSQDSPTPPKLNRQRFRPLQPPKPPPGKNLPLHLKGRLEAWLPLLQIVTSLFPLRASERVDRLKLMAT